MAFTVTYDERITIGNKLGIKGIYYSDGTTGGDITTGLRMVETVMLQPFGTSVSNKPAVDETLPLYNTDGKVTIVTGSGETGCFLIIGV